MASTSRTRVNEPLKIADHKSTIETGCPRSTAEPVLGAKEFSSLNDEGAKSVICWDTVRKDAGFFDCENAASSTEVLESVLSDPREALG